MTSRAVVSTSRISGILLVLGALACFIGASIYVSGQSDPGRSSLEYIWERGFVVSAVILSAIGFVVLEDALQDSATRAVFRMGSAGYFSAGVLPMEGEALAFTLGWGALALLISLVRGDRYLAQAFIGGALIRSAITSRWLGWATLVWNLGWLLALLMVGWELG